MFAGLDVILLELFNGSSSSVMDGLVLTLTSGYTWIPLYIALLYLVIYNSETMTQIALVVGCALLCVILSGGICDYIVKPLVGRLRPINDPMLCDVVNAVKGYYVKDFSFFSSHAANTFSLTLFFSLLVRKLRLSVALLIWAIINCYTRLYLGAHYPSDVLMGIIWGAMMGILSYLIYNRLYNRISSGGEFVSTQYTSKGYSIVTVDIVIITLIALYILAFLRALIIS